MGQQQLLLLVLGIVLVGLAVVVGIAAFGEGSKKARLDRQQSALSDIAASVHTWRMKPQAVGGGQGGNWNVTFPKMGMNGTASSETMQDIPNVGCAELIAAENDAPFAVVRIYDIPACPADQASLPGGALAARMRVFEDHWSYYFGTSGDGTWTHIYW